MSYRLFVLCYFFTLVSFAQRDSLSVNALGEVLLYGKHAPTQRINPDLFSVNTINATDLQQMAGTNLADVLNQQLNISITPNAATGRSTVSMFGLSGDYVKILIDNVPLVSDNGYGNDIDLTQINLENVERIEIVEGALGVLYGDNAVAGVINIITKKSASSSWRISASLQEETVGSEYNFSNEGRHTQNLYVSHNIDSNWFAAVNFSRTDFNGFKNTYFGKDYFKVQGSNIVNDGLRGYEWSPKLQHNMNGLLRYATPNLSLYYKFNYYNEALDIYSHAVNSRVIGGEYEITSNDQEYKTNRYSHELQASGSFPNQMRYDAVLSLQQQTRDYRSFVYNLRSRQEENTIEAFTNQSSDLWFSKGTLSNMFARSEELDLTAGYEITYQKGYDAVASGEYSDEVVEHDLGNYDVFAQLGYKYNDLWIYPGLRLNNNSNYGSRLIWSASANYRFPRSVELKLSAGSAYKTPSFTNLYYYFVDSNHNVQGNPDLEPEDGISLVLNVKKDSNLDEDVQLTNSLKLYHFDIQDKIALAFTGTSSEMKYLNIHRYQVLGASLENSLRYRNFKANLGLSYNGISQELNTENSSNAEDYLFNLNATASLHYYWPKHAMRFSALFKYNGELEQYVLDPNSSQYERGLQEDYSLLDVTIHKQFLDKKLEVSLGARNLLDVVRVNNSAIASTDHGVADASLLFGHGRSYFLKLVYNLNF